MYGHGGGPAKTDSSDIFLANHIEKFKKYEADYTRRLMAKYFSKKNLYGGNVFDENTTIDDELIKSSRWPCTRSYADPVQAFEDQNSSESVTIIETAPVNISNGKHPPKKNVSQSADSQNVGSDVNPSAQETPLPTGSLSGSPLPHFDQPTPSAIRERAKAAAEKEKQPDAIDLGLRIIGVSICHPEGRNLTEQDSLGDPAIMGIVLPALLTEQRSFPGHFSFFPKEERFNYFYGFHGFDNGYEGGIEANALFFEVSNRSFPTFLRNFCCIT